MIEAFFFIMTFHVYILYSKSINKYYKGQTNNIEDRLRRHNSGYEKATSNGIPWTLVCLIQKSTRAEAIILERKIKNMNLNKTIAFIEKYGGSSQDVGSAKS